VLVACYKPKFLIIYLFTLLQSTRVLRHPIVDKLQTISYITSTTHWPIITRSARWRSPVSWDVAAAPLSGPVNQCYSASHRRCCRSALRCHYFPSMPLTYVMFKLVIKHSRIFYATSISWRLWLQFHGDAPVNVICWLITWLITADSSHDSSCDSSRDSVDSHTLASPVTSVFTTFVSSQSQTMSSSVVNCYIDHPVTIYHCPVKLSSVLSPWLRRRCTLLHFHRPLPFSYHRPTQLTGNDV